ncbi:hypothetical protein [Nocardiopsis dassonvillei]|uniref:hypothetical protein n=1 Tax=Nocardiopsis dassonvillei TaxID=2014 RepID=UPI003F546185
MSALLAFVDSGFVDLLWAEDARVPLGGLLLITARVGLPLCSGLALALWWARVRRPLAATALLYATVLLCQEAAMLQDTLLPFAPGFAGWTVLGCPLIGGAVLVLLLRGRGIRFTAGIAALLLLVPLGAAWGWHAYMRDRHVTTTVAELSAYEELLARHGSESGNLLLLDAPGWKPRNATVFRDPAPHSILVYEGSSEEVLTLTQEPLPPAVPQSGGPGDLLWEGCSAPGAECLEVSVPEVLGTGPGVLRLPGPAEHEGEHIRLLTRGGVVTLAHGGGPESSEAFPEGSSPGPRAEVLVELLDRIRPVGPDDLLALAEADTRTLAEIR